ncbi:hypothetical protein [Embleya hyalina]|uniref:Uncharacterized protein n=1 Tax=Embleya hyalina TaxID=516124 RepID=A0A401YYN6_9ACTN|nr:hypothetical protein [Embleya hyalina]GCD99744.1 hypothetical protein EHYA_07466 [Embleya hyalina]
MYATPTTSYGFEFTIGDEFDLADVPLCCDGDMTRIDDGADYLTYKCGICETTVRVTRSTELVFDIH